MVEDKVVKSLSELEDLHQENKGLQPASPMVTKEEPSMDDWLKDKIVDWQDGQSMGLGAREKGSIVAMLFNKINDLTKEVEELKNGK